MQIRMSIAIKHMTLYYIALEATKQQIQPGMLLPRQSALATLPSHAFLVEELTISKLLLYVSYLRWLEQLSRTVS